MENFKNKDNGKLDDVESSVLVNIVNKWSQFLNDTAVTSRQKKLAWENIALTFNKATYDEKKRRRPAEFLIEQYERLQSQHPEENIKKNEVVTEVKKPNLKKCTTKRPKSRKRDRKVNGMTNNEPKENPPRKVPLLLNEEFKEQVLSSSRTAERLNKKEIKLRMEQSRETHAKTMELMELKKKTMLVELNRLRAAAHNERRKRIATDGTAEGDSDGLETRKNSAQKGLEGVKRVVNETSKKGSSGFGRWWKSMFGKTTVATSCSGAVTGTHQTEHSQERAIGRNYGGEQHATVELSRMTLRNEVKHLKDERVSEWLIGETKPEISHDDGEAGLREDEDTGISGNPINGGHREKSTAKKILIEEIFSERTQTADDM